MQKPKGTKDIFGKDQKLRQFILKTISDISDVFNYERIETPIFESKDVFKRQVGETSDIVTKEMYEFQDKAKRDLVLRPEATSSTIRAIVENKLYANPLPLKLYYEGPMFRYENPQKGRQRQFNSYGVEVIGDKSPFLDSEVIMLAATILDTFKVKYTLKINSLGSKQTRGDWSSVLKKYFKKYEDKLEKVSVERLDKNPMRILDDKKESKKDFVKNAPNISEFYSKEDKEYFEEMTKFLDNIGIKFEVDHNLVRGLDYYTDTVFEFISDSSNSGSQDTIIGGGRYQNLIEQFGGPKVSGVGFGLGIERLANELSDIKEEQITEYPEVYVMNIDKEVTATALGIVYMLRKSGVKTAWNYKPAKINKAFEKADKAKAIFKIIVGMKDLQNQSVTIKFGAKQEVVLLDNILEFLDNNQGGIND